MDKTEGPKILKCLNIDQEAGFIEMKNTDPRTRFIARVARDASENAIANALSHGRSVTILQDNSIVEVHPDGRTDIIKKLEKSSVIPEKRVYYL